VAYIQSNQLHTIQSEHFKPSTRGQYFVMLCNQYSSAVLVKYPASCTYPEIWVMRSLHLQHLPCSVLGVTGASDGVGVSQHGRLQAHHPFISLHHTLVRLRHKCLPGMNHLTNASHLSRIPKYFTSHTSHDAASHSKVQCAARHIQHTMATSLATLSFVFHMYVYIFQCMVDA
jgi:hypothetical protein